MKRLPILGALASIALGCLSLITPQSAQAAPVACHNVAASGSYPSVAYTQYCGSAALADGQAMRNALLTTQVGNNELRTAAEGSPYTQPGITFYVFENITEYHDNFPTGPGPANDTDFGFVQYDATHTSRPASVVILMQNIAGTTETDTQVQHTTGIWAAHALDSLMGYIADGGIIKAPYPKVSATSGTFQDFNNQLTPDWTAFNKLQACHNNTTGTDGIFSKQADPTKLPTTAYICNGTAGNGTALNPAYASLANNKAILQQIWPAVFGTGNTAAFWQEAFATFLMEDSDATYAGIYSVDHYLQPAGMAKQFTCSNSIQTYMAEHGYLPSDISMPTGCAHIPTVAYAVKLFSSDAANRFPDGRVFASLNVSNASTIQLNLEKLGSLGGGVTDSAIKKKLDAAGANVYLFLSPSDEAAAFQGAGLSTQYIDFTNHNADTWNNGDGTAPPMYWITAINETSNQIGQNTSKATYITTHELGHVVDFTTGQPSQGKLVPPTGGSQFDLAMQHDWLNIDYAAYPGTLRQPCWVKGEIPQGGTVPATYTGPLANALDPINSNAPFCADGVMTTSEAGYWGTHHNSYILQSVDDFQRVSPYMYELNYETTANPAFGWNNPISIAAGWREMFAQGLAIQAAGDEGVTTSSNEPIIDNAVTNGYFGCIAGTGTGTLLKGWMYYVYRQTAVVLDASCTSALPAGFTAVY